MVRVENLSVSFKDDGKVAVDNSTFTIKDGEIVGIVGESGSGKSMTALAIMGLMKEGATVGGKVFLDDKSLLELTYKEWCEIRGNDISMVFQEPMTSLNPLMRVGAQILEVLLKHGEKDKEAAKSKVIEAMTNVGLKELQKVYNQYPHELSGGMRQRIMIAMATVLEPKLLIADEPTTALDSATQEQIIELLKKINNSKKMSILFITHNLRLAREICNRVIVMQGGKIVEINTASEIFENPVEDYTKKLIGAIPKRVKLKEVMANEAGTDC